MKISNKLLYREFLSRENEIMRAPYNPELEFYNAIRDGDIKKVRDFCKEPFSEKTGLGILSNNSLQNMKYHFAITAALIARYCIEGGMEFNGSYTLSDYYILSADQCTSLQELSDLHRSMCMNYTKRMQDMRKQKIRSKQVLQCIEYIYEHLFERITVDVLAAQAKLSPAYLSRLFKKETGVCINAYIQSRKLETAQNMLQYSDYSVSEISAILAYPSHSYFTEVFHRKTGMTPSQYRAAFYRKMKV
ncbi:MAG: helix-turn-helix transcriptional regulator [Lachnospiraceae bacterium]|nr:helix-turn-helix transcriptional regulator [Lachnospiraceae bacterium]